MMSVIFRPCHVLRARISWRRLPVITTKKITAVRCLCTSPARLNPSHQSPLSELHTAAQEGDMNRMKMATEFADLNSRDHNGWTALMFAARHNHPHILQLLLSKSCHPDIRCTLGHTALEIGKFWNSVDCVDLLTDVNSGSPDKAWPSHYFTSSPLVRASHMRGRSDDVLFLSQKQRARFLLTHQNKALLKTFPVKSRSGRQRTGYRLWYTTHEALSEMNIRVEDFILLGFYDRTAVCDAPSQLSHLVSLSEINRSTEGVPQPEEHEVPVFVQPLNDEQLQDVLSKTEDVVLSESRPSMLTLPMEDAAISAHALGLADWHWRYKFCASCGGETTMEQSGYKRRCKDAQCISNSGIRNTSYPRTDISVIASVSSPDHQHTLLVRMKAMYPKMYSCVSGYIEPGESLEESCAREIYEETGVELSCIRYHSSQFWPYPAVLMAGFLATAKDTRLQLDRNELEDGRWFSRSEAAEAVTRTHGGGLMTPPPQAIAHHLIKAWLLDTYQHS